MLLIMNPPHITLQVQTRQESKKSLENQTMYLSTRKNDAYDNTRWLPKFPNKQLGINP